MIQNKLLNSLTLLILIITLTLVTLINGRLFDPPIATAEIPLIPAPLTHNTPSTTTLATLPPPPFTLHIKIEQLSKQTDQPYQLLWLISSTLTHTFSIYPIGLFSFTDQYPPQRWPHLHPNQPTSELWLSVTDQEMLFWLNREYLLSYPSPPPTNLSITIPENSTITISHLTISHP